MGGWHPKKKPEGDGEQSELVTNLYPYHQKGRAEKAIAEWKRVNDPHGLELPVELKFLERGQDYAEENFHGDDKNHGSDRPQYGKKHPRSDNIIHGYYPYEH